MGEDPPYRPDVSDETIAAFVAVVEEVAGKTISVDTLWSERPKTVWCHKHVDEYVGGFYARTTVELQGVVFNCDVQYGLSLSEVVPTVAVIEDDLEYYQQDTDELRAILEEETGGQKHGSYFYEIVEGDVSELTADLMDAHAIVFD
jgi:hypothetical protein